MAVLACGALARLPALLLGVEHYGDAPVRIETAERWLAAPHLWRGYAEAFQYGPLHRTALAGATRLLGRYSGPKLLSFACGLLCLWLLVRLTRRATGEAAALIAGLGLAFSPLHIQASSTGASEAVFLALLLGAIDRLFAAREAGTSPRGALLASAALTGLCCLVRYDGLLYLGLLALLLLWDGRARAAILYFASAALLPGLWLLRCWQIDGHPLAPLRYINQDHLALAVAAVRWFGATLYRLYCLPYWPVAVLGLCTPVLGAAALWGSARTLWTVRPRKPPGAAQALALLAWLPAAYFTFRASVLLDFRPLSRFALVAATLSLPLAGPQLLMAAARLSTAGRRALAGLAALTLVGTPAALVALSYGRDGVAAEWARPLSPIATLPPGVEAAARYLRANAGPADVVLVDSTWHYLDIVLAFETGLPEAQLVRYRWPDFEEKLVRTAPTMAVLLEGGSLFAAVGAEGAHLGAARFSLRGTQFCAARQFVYASVYRRCP